MNEQIILSNDLSYAVKTLTEYKKSKKDLEDRIRREEQVWKRIYSGGASSSWIFNSIVNKHADVIDSIPTCVCLPREKNDEYYAGALSEIIPVIMGRRNFEGTYSDNSWSKLKHGTAVYGVFWNNSFENGLGDVDVRAIPLTDIFWEPGITDIQDSENIFIVKLCARSELYAQYGFINFSAEEDMNIRSCLGFGSDESKCLVVDWYYKKPTSSGGYKLHLCKFVGDAIVFASADLPEYENGWYEHGLYPVVFDKLYPTEDVCGFGLISIAEATQTYINRIDGDMLAYADWASKVRFWAKRSLGINEKEFLDLGRSIVEVEGDIDEEKLRQIEISPIDTSVIDVRKMKIEELKEITGSRDVSQGGYSSSVTAAKAISILQEAGAKTSRDGIEETYRAYVKIVSLVIELISQFYVETRVFRIVGDNDKSAYLTISRQDLNMDGKRSYFDIEVKALKKSPSLAEQKNQLAKDLYDAGAFKRENLTETMLMLSIMDFEGVGSLKYELSLAYGYDSSEGTDVNDQN